MVYRVYVEKKPAFALEAKSLLKDLRTFLGIESLTGLRLLNRYDVEDLEKAHFDAAIQTLFSEPQMDAATPDLPVAEGATVFATEYLPGQFDQRADSAAQCIQLAFECERPTVRSSRVFLLEGKLSKREIDEIKKYVINPVESREASLDLPKTLRLTYDVPTSVETLTGFIQMDEPGLAAFIQKYALAMDLADIKFCQGYFQGERRDPTLTEIRMIDTYWSDHCRHTTFLTTLSKLEFEDTVVKAAFERYLAVREELGRTEKPMTLMDMATIGAKYLKHKGQLPDIDESEEINACTIKIDVDVNGQKEPWLLLFKNETHNHPTEIEPFGGAATCIGGAIRDPLSGRSYVYQAMRVTGAADPTAPLKDTIPGKLPQRKLVTTAAAGYSSYGNQIGLATGIVDEIYHPGYAAKRLEIGAVVGAAPQRNVRREVPQPGDIIVLLGGRTGRDGCGGATGSSKSHTAESLETCGAEVQKGNAPEERKLQRLFRNEEAARLIKRCNDFGAGGVSVAIGELADGLVIELDVVPKKYDGLDGTELAISESQERMAVALDPKDVARFMELAAEENLEATAVAKVTSEKRLVMNWKGAQIVNLSRAFINSNGAEKHTDVVVPAARTVSRVDHSDFDAAVAALASDLNTCSKRGLAERFDSTIGANSVLMPFGGRRQRTPAQAMVARMPVLHGKSGTCSAMAFGFNPFVSEASPYRGAYLAVVESAAKLVATGAGLNHAHLTFQEYFPRTQGDPRRWGLPTAALLGALSAQLDLGLAAIGGKDSMSGTFENLDVPPTLVSFAVSVCEASQIISPEFKCSGSPVVLLAPVPGDGGLPDADSLKAVFGQVTDLMRTGKVRACYTPGMGGLMEALFKMALGNAVGFRFDDALTMDRIMALAGQNLTGGFVLELTEDMPVGLRLGVTLEDYTIRACDQIVDVLEWEAAYEGRLESVFACNIETNEPAPEKVHSFCKDVHVCSAKVAKPRVLIPAFPGTNCEVDSARAFEAAGAEVSVCVIRNRSAQDVSDSVKHFAALTEQSQIVFLPGGFSGGDEPDGSAKFITAFLRNPLISEKLMALLQHRDGLMGGICNGFQALIKLGLVPYGEIREPDPNAPTLTYNLIGRHQSKLVRAAVCSNLSPWLRHANVGDIHLVPMSHGEGRFVIAQDQFQVLAGAGQIATQYVDELGRPSMDIQINPNGSMYAVEGITSPDGRVFGRMGHAERCDESLYVNVAGDKNYGMFGSAVTYFTAN